MSRASEFDPQNYTNLPWWSTTTSVNPTQCAETAGKTDLLFKVILEHIVISKPVQDYETLSQSETKIRLAATKHLNLCFLSGSFLGYRYSEALPLCLLCRLVRCCSWDLNREVSSGVGDVPLLR